MKKYYRKHDYFCFLCGGELYEIDLGFVECSKCSVQFLPFIDENGYYCLCCVDKKNEEIIKKKNQSKEELKC